MVAEHVEKMQQRSEEFGDKLSAGTYAWKQLRNMVVNLVGQVGGGVAGWQIAKHIKYRGPASMLEPLRERFPEWMAKHPKTPVKAAGAFIGTTIGSTAALLYLGYEHWAQAEAQRLAINEVNQDIAQARLRMNPELLQENKMLREMLAQQEPNPANRPQTVVAMKDAELETSPVAPHPETKRG